MGACAAGAPRSGAAPDAADQQPGAVEPAQRAQREGAPAGVGSAPPAVRLRPSLKYGSRAPSGPAGSSAPSRRQEAADRPLRHHHARRRSAAGQAQLLRPRIHPLSPCSVAVLHRTSTATSHAFEAVLAAAETARRRPDALRRLGDLVGYGAEPDACAALAAAPHARVCLAGNHDLAVRRGDLLARTTSRAAPPLAAALDPGGDLRAERVECLADARARPATARSYGLFHASPRDPVWEYVLSALHRRPVLLSAQRRTASRLIGHSHVALAVRPPDEGGRPRPATTRRQGTDARPLDRGEWLVDPGLGRPAARRRPPRGLAAARHRAPDRQLPAGRSTTSRAPQAAIRAARLPDSLAERLQYGQ